jgi:hypothetical protein
MGRFKLFKKKEMVSTNENEMPFKTQIINQSTVEKNNADTFTFGQWRDHPLQWRVLKKEFGRVLLITEDCIAVKPFHAAPKNANWQTCTLRGWLNQDFFSSTFTEEEKQQILTSDNRTERDVGYGKGTWFITNDRVFLLSKEEAEQYFVDDASRCAQMMWTKKDVQECLHIITTVWKHHANSWNDKELFEEHYLNKKMPYYWWLRTPGRDETEMDYNAMEIGHSGNVYVWGDHVGKITGGVRPVIWLSTQ